MKQTLNNTPIPESCLASVSGSSNRVLKLTLKKQWFDMILSGEKTEEYREVKRYWIQRLCNEIEYENNQSNWEAVFKKYDWVEFTNGYNKNSPKVTLECKGIEIGMGFTDWGAIGHEDYFIIKLGREIVRSNFH
jgi:hypothetical protein